MADTPVAFLHDLGFRVNHNGNYRVDFEDKAVMYGVGSNITCRDVINKISQFFLNLILEHSEAGGEWSRWAETELVSLGQFELRVYLHEQRHDDRFKATQVWRRTKAGCQTLRTTGFTFNP